MGKDYVAKNAAETLAGDAADAAAEKTAAVIDRKLKDYVTSIQEARDIEKAKDEVLQEIGQKYVTGKELENKLNELKEHFGSQIAEHEETKNIILDEHGNAWRIVVENGELRIAQLETEG